MVISNLSTGIGSDETIVRRVPKETLPLHYNGWRLPGPPSIDDCDRDTMDSMSIEYPAFEDLEKGLDERVGTPETPMQSQLYSEWKRDPVRRAGQTKMSKSNRGKRKTTTSSQAADAPQSRTRSSRISRNKGVRRGQVKIKEEAPRPSSFRPRFSRTRYKKQQKFRSLLSHKHEQMKAESRQDEPLDNLVRIRKELSGLKLWPEKKQEERSDKKRVQFSYPLVSALNYRPKTLPEEIDDLYFHEDDLLDWEEDRENTSSERFEIIFTEERAIVDASIDCGPVSSFDSDL